MIDGSVLMDSKDSSVMLEKREMTTVTLNLQCALAAVGNVQGHNIKLTLLHYQQETLI